MRKFIISTDSTADLPKEFYEKNEIAIHPLDYIIDGVEYGIGKEEIPPAKFYEAMSQGTMATTCASNPEYIERLMKEQVRQGYDILHISFSSALSSSYNNAAVCARMVMEEEEGCKIIVVDSLSATCGQGLLVYWAVKMREQGKTMEEIAEWIEEHRGQVVHQFTVDDLHHLVRGGRLKKSAAIVGTALQLKPILHVDDNGGLEPIGKVRGRKKALKELVETMQQNRTDEYGEVVMISHAGCPQDAHAVADRIKELYKGVDVYVEDMCPTIGAHTGVGCVLLSYFGKKR